MLDRVTIPGPMLAALLALAVCALAAGCDDSSGATEERDTQVEPGDSVAGDVDAEPGDVAPDEGDTSPLCADGSAPCAGICCASGEVCSEAQQCVTDTCEGVRCGTACCAAGEVCDSGALACAQPCAGGDAPCNGNCCTGDRICETGQCRANCEASQRCGDRVESEVCCDGATEVCEGGQCQLDCAGAARCGVGASTVCCAMGEVCESGECKAQCGGTRCGASDELCCAGVEQCLFDLCLETHGPCVDHFDCELDEYCETSIGQCVKVTDDPNQCIYVPPVGDFAPEVQWHWSGSDQFPTYNQVMMTPSVANLNDDNGDGVIDENDVPDVVFGTFAGSGYNGAGVVRVASGDDGRELAASADRQFGVSRNMAIGDIDGDSVPEIIASSCRSCVPREVYALELQDNGTGVYTLAVTATATLGTETHAGASAAIADLEGDGSVEVVTEFGILEGADLAVRCTASWSFPVTVDLDEDGTMEIVANGQIWNTQCEAQLPSGASGHAAVADLLPDGGGVGDLVPEIVWVRPALLTGTIELWDVTRQPTGEWAMTQVWATTIPINAERILSIYNITCDASSTSKACNTGGGPPTIADFDGDGIPEISTAARWYYIVLENDGQILWADATTKDFSSAVTGSSVFDFEGDGKAEVVYADEELLRVYKGTGSGADGDGDGFNDAEVLYSQANPSGTLFEYPLIVDVDNDGNAEIVLAANNYAFPGVTGIRVFRDPLDNWVRTRRIWNQHTYHVTNIEEDGTVPSPARINWNVPGLNNFRQNVQPGGLFNAPNLLVDAVARDDAGCPTRHDIAVTVSNDGSLGVGPGLWVGVYAVGLPAPDERALLGRAQIGTAIAPGGSATVVVPWDGSATLLPSGTQTTLTAPLEVVAVVDDPPMAPGSNGEHNECVETDNTSAPTLIEACPLN